MKSAINYLFYLCHGEFPVGCTAQERDGFSDKLPKKTGPKHVNYDQSVCLSDTHA